MTRQPITDWFVGGLTRQFPLVETACGVMVSVSPHVVGDHMVVAMAADLARRGDCTTPGHDAPLTGPRAAAYGPPLLAFTSSDIGCDPARLFT